MRYALAPVAAVSVLVFGTVGAAAQTAETTEQLAEIDKPASQLEEILAQDVEIPGGPHTIRVVTATVDPSTAAAWHTHPSPVYVYVREGSLSMEVEGQEPKELTAGQATAEPLNAQMRVVNRGDVPAELVVFQVSPVEAAFLEQAPAEQTPAEQTAPAAPAD